ncbi:MAG TPA: 30S ribosomal protein S7 [Thermoflexia bacterium]|jgi:small subunit ribosomal protein S7|nr:30S ribosomal protein S7 [Thermoflexia bacterium]HID88229.1 30S ribosomal protein S7 [Anaerolineae bacterium]
MPRRYRPPRRKVEPDIRYNSELVARFINKVMKDGKKSLATRIVYNAMDLIEERTKRPALEVFEEAIRNVSPLLEVKPRRVGGATYQVPVEVPPHRQISLAMRWIIAAARQRPGRSMAEKLAAELIDAANKTGAAIKKREDTHRMAEANRAFAHYRW